MEDSNKDLSCNGKPVAFVDIVIVSFFSSDDSFQAWVFKCGSVVAHVDVVASEALEVLFCCFRFSIDDCLSDHAESVAIDAGYFLPVLWRVVNVS